MYRTWENGKFTDAVVKCAGEEWKVHRIILASHSEFFAKCFGGQFKVRLRRRAGNSVDDR